MKKKRGCCKPGHNYRDNATYVSASLSLAENNQPARIYECPLGKVIRETPWVMRIPAFSAFSEQSGFEFFNLPKYTQTAISIYSGEQARVRDEDHEQEKMKAQGRYGTQVLRRASGG